MTTYQKQTAEIDYVNLPALFQHLIEKKYSILFGSLFICCLVMLYTFTQPKKYQATLLLQVQQKQADGLAIIPKPTQQMNAANIHEEPIAIQMALIRSQFILYPVIKTLGLDIAIYRNNALFPKKLANENNQIQLLELHVPSRYLKKKLKLIIDDQQHFSLYNHRQHLLMHGNIGTLVTQGDFSIHIKSVHVPSHSQFILVKSPESEVMHKILTNFMITDLSGSAENAENKVGILQLSLLGNDPIMITNILNTIAYVTQKKNIERKIIQAEKTLLFLNQQLPLAQKTLQEAEAKLNQYRSTSGKIDLKLQMQYLMTQLNDIDKQLTDVRLKKANLLQQYTIHHPVVISLNQKMQELLHERYDIETQLKKLPAADQMGMSLTRDMNVKNHLYLLLLNQIHELQVIKAGIISDIHILLSASVPDRILPIKFLVILLFSLIFGMLLSSIASLILYFFKRRIDDPEWTEKIWNIRHIVTVPYSKAQKLSSVSTKQKSLLSWHSPHDIALQSLHHLRVYLQLNVTKAQNNIITLLGIKKGIGKSFIAVNLAGLLARMGHKTLLIDADIQNGPLYQYTHATSTMGLVHVLHGEISVDEAIHPSDKLPHLFFLAAGKSSKPMHEIRMPSAFKTRLAALQTQYEYIIINTAPNLVYTDSHLISLYAGINLLVVGRKSHKAIDLDVAIRNLERLGIPLHGSVFNHAEDDGRFAAAHTFPFYLIPKKAK